MADRIRVARAMFNLTKKQLAQRLTEAGYKTDEGTVGDWESGEIKSPGPERMRLLADWLGVDFETFATGPGLLPIEPGAANRALALVRAGNAAAAARLRALAEETILVARQLAAPSGTPAAQATQAAEDAAHPGKARRRPGDQGASA